MNTRVIENFFVIGALLFSTKLLADEYELTPVSTIIGSNYQLMSLGGLRFEAGKFGVSRLAYTNGAFAISESDKLIYISGHDRHFSLAGFAMDKPPKHGDISALPLLKNVMPFVKIAPKSFNTKTANMIKGVEVIDNSLLVSTEEYYDADVNNKEHLVIFKNRHNLSTSDQNGFFSIEGASHATGWMSKIPEPLSNQLGYLYLTGSASNLPINSRQSLGPTFFGWFPFFIGDVKSAKNLINTEPLINYSLEKPLHKDVKNLSGSNNLWTELSTAVYGFIAPDQKNYIVVGYSGGHHSKIGYKVIQSNGYKCGGICASDITDYYNYYWMYSIDDIKRSKNKSIAPNQLKPISYGKLNLFNHKHLIIGADFDANKKTLYLLIDQLDNTQNEFETQPILMSFKLSTIRP